MSGQPAFVDVHAIDDVEALLIRPRLPRPGDRRARTGERIMRALILRRVALVEAGAGGPVLIGAESTPDVIRLQGSSPAMRTHINCSIRHRTAMQRNWSNNMLQIPRICRWPYVRKDRS